jgi:cytochrome d ubiquinol oxidase subunit I
MVLAAYLTTALVVGATGAWHLLRLENSPAAKKMFSMALWMLTIVAPLQILAGDLHGINTLEHQPAKIAAMEGHYETQRGAPLILFGIPDDEAEVTRYQLALPKVGSLILTHGLDGEVPGLKSFPKDGRPPAEIVFWSFRIMVAIGFAMLALGLWSLLVRWRGRLAQDRWLQRASVIMGPAGFGAVIAGWITTEVGRQPWTVYGQMTTAQSVSPIDAPAVGASLVAFIIVYFAVFGAGTFYILRLMGKQVEAPAGEAEEDAAHSRAAGIVPGPAIEATENR